LSLGSVEGLIGVGVCDRPVSNLRDGTRRSSRMDQFFRYDQRNDVFPILRLTANIVRDSTDLYEHDLSHARETLTINECQVDHQRDITHGFSTPRSLRLQGTT
jgi:hypothetical protein